MKMRTKLICLLIVIVMVIGMVPATTYAGQGIETERSDLSFIDMPDDWSTTALTNAVENGLLSGYDGYIAPNDDLTRAQMAAIINRVFATTEKSSLKRYTDVAENSWYYSDMAKAVHMETFIGSNNKLYPDNSITREEVFTAFARAFKLSGASKSVLNKFSDKNLVSSWAQDGVASLVEAGYIEGLNDKLKPKKNITRAEIAQLLDNIIKKYISKAETYTVDIDGNVMINAPNVTLKDMVIKGDLIIGDGVGDGDVTLNCVTITGRTIIRGGGVNSIKIFGNSNIQKIIVARVNGQLRLYVEDGSEIGEIIVDGNDDVIIEGKTGTIIVTASNITITGTNAKIKSCILEGENVKLKVLKGTEIKNAVVNGQGADISGEGEVGKVEANADNITVTTHGTKVIASVDTKNVLAGGIPVIGGNSQIVHDRNNSSTKKYELKVIVKPELAGTVNNSNYYKYGNRIEITTEPNTDINYQFVNWTLNGSVVSTSESFEYIMPASNITLVANYIPQGSIPIATVSDLHNIKFGLGKDYVQVANIDLSVSPYDKGVGWIPIGNYNGKFIGSYDGNDYEIRSLYIDDKSEDNAGLFGIIDNAYLKNVNLLNINISACNNVGGLIGTSFGGSVTNSHVEGSIDGDYLVGGIIGLNQGSDITDSHSSGDVTGNYLVGGLVGASSSTGAISNCSSDASVNGYYMVGGLIGKNLGTINDCFAMGSVIAREVDTSSLEVQAARAGSFSTLYEAIAKKPEAAETLISTAIKLTGEAGDMLSAEAQAARVASFSALYEAIVEKPEAAETLTSTAKKLTGEAGDMSSQEAQAARVASFSTLYEAIAEKPEAAETLISTATKLTGEAGDMSSTEVQVARVVSLSALYESIGRRPEAAETLTSTVIKLTGEAVDMSSAEVQAARVASFSALYETIGRRPEVAEILTSTATKLTGEAGDMSSAEVQAARVASFSKLYEAIARQPEAAETLTSTAIKLTGEAVDMSSAEVQAARVASFSALYETIGRRPEVAEILTSTATKLTGEAGDMSSAEVQAARVASFSKLYEAIARQPEAAETLTSTAIKLTGEAGDMSSAQVQAARVASFSKLYEAIARQPEAAETLVEAAIELTGEAGDMSSAQVQAARVASFSKLYEAIGRQPEAAAILVEAARELAGEAGDMSSAQVQAARVASFSKLYEAIKRQPGEAETLIEAARELAGEKSEWTSPQVQAARAASFSTLYDAVARQSKLEETLIEAARELAGEKSEWTSPQVQAARAASFSTLYELIVLIPESEETIMEVVEELTGVAEDWFFPKVQTGGLVGLNSGTITSSYSTGDIAGRWYAGGLAGYNSGSITDSFAVNTKLGASEGYMEGLSFGRITGVNTGILGQNYANNYMEEPFEDAFIDRVHTGKDGGNLKSWYIGIDGKITTIPDNY